MIMAARFVSRSLTPQRLYSCDPLACLIVAGTLPRLKAFGDDSVRATYGLQNAAQAIANQGAIKGVSQNNATKGGAAKNFPGGL